MKARHRRRKSLQGVHISERPIPMPEEKESWILMAIRFREMTGIDPFTVDQQTMLAHSRPEAEPIIYRDAVARGWVKKKAVVFTERNGKAWTPPTEFMSVDAQVFLPPVTFDKERPDWLARDLKRISYQIPTDLLLNGSGIRLVQAFYEGEANNAVPVDQILVRPAQSSAWLMLPRLRQGRLRLRMIDEKGKIVITQKLKI